MGSPYTPIVALLTDFGTSGWYVASMKGVILTLCPKVQLVDLSHNIPAQDILLGAFTLAACTPWFPPETVFACVVDPGVGTARPLIAVQADDHRFVGPDNGLLSLVLQRAKRRQLIRLTNPRYWLPQVSQTFHGRDIIAPVAAHMASGVPLKRLGIPMTRYRTLEMPRLRRGREAIHGCVLCIDAFGNLITNLPEQLLKYPMDCAVRYKNRPVRVVSSYGEGRKGELVGLIGSAGYLELAVRNGSAARRCRAQRGDPVILRQRPCPS